MNKQKICINCGALIHPISGNKKEDLCVLCENRVCKKCGKPIVRWTAQENNGWCLPCKYFLERKKRIESLADIREIIEARLFEVRKDLKNLSDFFDSLGPMDGTSVCCFHDKIVSEERYRLEIEILEKILAALDRVSLETDQGLKAVISDIEMLINNKPSRNYYHHQENKSVPSDVCKEILSCAHHIKASFDAVRGDEKE